jgi:hypothetical protein
MRPIKLVIRHQKVSGHLTMVHGSVGTPSDGVAFNLSYEASKQQYQNTAGREKREPSRKIVPDYK